MPTQLAADDFNRANSGDIGTAWDPNAGHSGAWEVFSNKVRLTSGTRSGDGCETYNAVSAPNDQYIECALVQTSANGAGVGYGVMGRFSSSAKTGYRLVGNASGWEIARFNAGSFTGLGSATSTTFAAGDVIRLELVTSGANCAWTVKKNGSTVTGGTGTDTSPIASGRPGVGYSSTDSTADADQGLDNWAFGDLGSAASNTLMGQVCT